MAVVKIINGKEVAAKMSAALKEIARLTGFSERAVTIAEAASILKQCAGRTKVARADQIDLRTRVAVLRKLGFTKSNSRGDITINAGRRGMAGLMWVKTQGARGQGKPFKLAGVQAFDGQKFTPANRHWKNADWTDIIEAQEISQLQLAKEIPLGRQSVGLARQSWIQIADDLGIRLESVPGGGASAAAIAKARSAIASDGRYHVNGRAAEDERKAHAYAVTLINSLPYHTKGGLDAVLVSVLAGRLGLFSRTFANGAYKSIASAAHNYPWMKVALAA